MATTEVKIDWEVKKAEWVKAVEGLAGDVMKWAKARKWEVASLQKELHEEFLGTYWAPTLRIQTENGTLMLDPVARNIVGGEGRVDLLAFPSFNRFLLLRQKDRWVLFTDSMVRWPNPWSKETFLALAKELTSPQ